MARYDAYNSECQIFSFKDGLLAKLAHDLKLQVERFSIEVDEDSKTITACFDPSSIRVVCARSNGQDDPSTLSEGDKKKILGNVTKDVLRVKKFPEIRFESSSVAPEGDGYKVAGALQLCGRTRNLQTELRSEDGRLVTEITIHQPDFGIKPFTAALGALKVKPDVLIRLSVPKDAG